MSELTPINVWAGAEEEIGRLTSNLAHTPIVVDGLEFGSVEAFISWLVTDPAKEAKRERIRPMNGEHRRGISNRSEIGSKRVAGKVR
jgi:hypothetical protein